MQNPFKDNSGTEDLVSVGGKAGVIVPTGAGTTLVKKGNGRLARVTITAAGTGAGNVTFLDAADNSGSGVVIAAIPATFAVPLTGALIFDIPFVNGLAVTNVANGPVINVVV